ncbi:ATP-grasp domain-containing protein [Aerococcus urinaehominis]|uniref:ATP-grasp domain-containing protein n=1 Tax=Aerococcus urinaehominis TaxID=128944 RepID=UPI0008902387|nr:ATP-grasp domain-containing protein [Aerococcus urinaehominis]SDL96094.1 ATP-grasp domain-containing protein [Aerococcus urinaehominis]
MESHEEYWLELDAKLRTDFNVFGLKADEMDRIKFKSGMKQVFLANDIPCTKGRVFAQAEEAWDLVEELGYPVIVKPDLGVGASDTWKINNNEDMDRFLHEKQDIDYMMEAFVDGKIVTFDGITNGQGKVAFYSSLNYMETALDLVVNDRDNVYYVPNHVDPDLAELGTRLVEAFNIPERFFHCEFFHLADGSYIALEINCRPAGGPSLDLVNYAYDMDIFAAYADLVTKGGLNYSPRPKHNAAYISRKYGRNYCHSQEDILARYGHFVKEVIYQPEVFAQVMGNVGYIVVTDDMASQEEIMHYILAEFSYE